MSATAHDFFEHVADIGVIGRGATLTDAFVGAAEAMFAVMADPAGVGEHLAVPVDFDESDSELALVTWLNRLLAEARLHAAVFRRFTLEREEAHYSGVAYGAPWSEVTGRGTEVKGATLTALSVRPAGAGWEARCVVDV